MTPSRRMVAPAVATMTAILGLIGPGPTPPSTVALAQTGTTTITTTKSSRIIRMAPAPAPGGAVMEVQVQAVAPGNATPTAPAPPPKDGELPADVFKPMEPAEAQKLAQEKAQRIQKIQQLMFDRRPSSILRAWASLDQADNEAKPNNAPGMPGRPGRDNPNGQPNQPDPFDDELKAFGRDVTLGRWDLARAFLYKLPDDEAKAAYARLVQGLAMPAMFLANQMMMQQQGRNMQVQQQPMNPQFMEKAAVGNADLVAIASSAPWGLDDDLLQGIGQIAAQAVAKGEALADLVDRLKAATSGLKPPLKPRQAAKILMGADHATDAKLFLPEPKQAVAEDDREALNLLSRHYLALYAKDKKAADLEKAWEVTQDVLAVGQVDPKQKDEALKRAVELAPKVREDLGEAWLKDSFTRRPERGMEVIAAIGVATSQGLGRFGQTPDARFKELELQKTAVEALLRASPEHSKDWAHTLTLLGAAWMAEAGHSHLYDTSTSLGPQMQRDMFGNFYYFNMNRMGMYNNQQNFPQPIAVGQVLEAAPGDAWLAGIEPSARPGFFEMLAKLYLKVGEDELAFPFVERIAAADRDKARELAQEFLRVWTKNHDPNAERNMRNPYMYMYGFERKAESIPLTRSKQERNLKELAGWVARLRKLPIGDLDEKLIARAFTSCHSAAEVYRLETIESVFGSFDALKPETLAEMAQQMRGNLASLWRKPEVQEQNKTKRKEKDIRAEVVRGYQVARSVVDRGLGQHPESWALALARAALLHDENNYRQEIEPSTDFSRRRGEAFVAFRRAADMYAAKAAGLAEEDETLSPYDQWFYSSIGACDLANVDEKTLADFRQAPLIREAIKGLPGESAERHMTKFANALFTRMSAANPAVKFRYLKAGFEIVGDHKHAQEARKVYDYYKDLVTEIKLDASIDGPVEVGSGRPFGVFINLVHTRDIERESGGFGRYLQNQNQGNFFFYNYGRPLENYRDKFNDIVKKAMEEQFEVVSVTFQDEKVNSRATAEYGWRYTPYAYVLLKARSPKVDKLPPVRLDLDFLDTSGYVILPVETPTVPIDATKAAPGRPFGKLQLTQTLDERQAKDGKLILEVKATSQGLVPDLKEIVDVGSPGFEVVKADDQGVSVSRFDPDSDANLIVSERTWLVDLKAVEGQETLPVEFRFPEPKVETAELTLQRYVDADLQKVGPVLKLGERYGEASYARPIAIAVGIGLTIAAAALAWQFRPRKAEAAGRRFAMPDPLTPFSALALLREIGQSGGLSETARLEVAESTRRIEGSYFAAPEGEPEDLRPIVEAWLHRTA